MRILHFVGNTGDISPHEYLVLTEGASLTRDFWRPGYHLASDTEIKAKSGEPYGPEIWPEWPLGLPLEKPMFSEKI